MQQLEKQIGTLYDLPLQTSIGWQAFQKWQILCWQHELQEELRGNPERQLICVKSFVAYIEPSCLLHPRQAQWQILQLLS